MGSSRKVKDERASLGTRTIRRHDTKSRKDPRPRPSSRLRMLRARKRVLL